MTYKECLQAEITKIEANQLNHINTIESSKHYLVIIETVLAALKKQLESMNAQDENSQV